MLSKASGMSTFEPFPRYVCQGIDWCIPKYPYHCNHLCKVIAIHIISKINSAGWNGLTQGGVLRYSVDQYGHITDMTNIYNRQITKCIIFNGLTYINKGQTKCNKCAFRIKLVKTLVILKISRYSNTCQIFDRQTKLKWHGGVAFL